MSTEKKKGEDKTVSKSEVLHALRQKVYHWVPVEYVIFLFNNSSVFKSVILLVTGKHFMLNKIFENVLIDYFYDSFSQWKYCFIIL